MVFMPFQPGSMPKMAPQSSPYGTNRGTGERGKTGKLKGVTDTKSQPSTSKPPRKF